MSDQHLAVSTYGRRLAMCLVWALTLTALVALPALSAPRITIIPDCQTPRVARDGTGVVAQSSVNVPSGEKQIFRWTPAAGVETFLIGERLREIFSAASQGAAATGQITVGNVIGIGPHYQMFRWSVADGFEILPHLHPTETARYSPGYISGDGNVIHGAQMGFPSVITDPARWIDGIPDNPLQPLPGSFSDAAPIATNGDGSAAYGWLSNNPLTSTPMFFRWTEQGGTQMVSPPVGFWQPQIINAAPESDTILGRGVNVLSEWQSFLIHADGSVDPLPYIGGGLYDRFTAKYLTGDASLILGDSFPFPLLWSEASGFVDVMDYSRVFSVNARVCGGC